MTTTVFGRHLRALRTLSCARAMEPCNSPRHYILASGDGLREPLFDEQADMHAGMAVDVEGEIGTAAAAVDYLKNFQ